MDTAQEESYTAGDVPLSSLVSLLRILDVAQELIGMHGMAQHSDLISPRASNARSGSDRTNNECSRKHQLSAES